MITSPPFTTALKNLPLTTWENVIPLIAATFKSLILSKTLFYKKKKQNILGSKLRVLANLIMTKRFMKQWFREQALY